MFTNGLNDTSYLPSGYYSSDWYISAGGFFPANGTISDLHNDHFSTETNHGPSYPRFIIISHLITTTFNHWVEILPRTCNYYDWRHYDNDTQQFELDLDALTAQLQADIVP